MQQLIILSIIISVSFGVILFLIIRKATNHSVNSVSNLIKQGKAANAIEPLKKMISKNPNSVDPHYLLAKAYMADNKNELAFMEIKTINKLGEFTSICPEREFRKISSKLFLQFNQPDEALKDLLLLIKLDPYESDHYLNVGCLFEQKNSSSKAIKYFKKAVELNPRNSMAYQHLGMIMFNTKRLKEAKHFLDTSVKYDQNNFTTYYYLGKIAKEARDYTKAIEYFENSLRERSIKVKAQIEIGICCMALDNNNRAITEFEKALSMVQRDRTLKTTEQQMIYARYFLSIAYERERDLDKAIKMWEWIQARKKNFKDVAEKLAEYKELRENDKMKDYLTSSHEEFKEVCSNICSAIKIDPQDFKQTKSGLDIVGVESGKKDWKMSKKLPILISFLREGTPVGELHVRNILDSMKNKNIMKGILISSSEITTEAKKYAESRPIDIIGKKKLVSILNQG